MLTVIFLQVFLMSVILANFPMCLLLSPSNTMELLEVLGVVFASESYMEDVGDYGSGDDVKISPA